MKMAVGKAIACSSCSRYRMQIFFILHIVVLTYELSDGASVPVLQRNNQLSQDLESLASSKILMDRTSSSSSSPSLENLVKDIRSTLPSPIGPRENKILSGDAGSANAALPIAHFNLNNGNNSPEIMSLLRVAQCRATCLEKFTDDHAAAATTPSLSGAVAELDSGSGAILTRKEILAWNGEAFDEIQILPKILRLRKKRNVDASTDDSKGSESRRLKTNKSGDCLRDSRDCLSCWKSCQLLETGKSDPEATTTMPSGFSSTSSSSPQPVSGKLKAKGNGNDVVEYNMKQNFLGKQFTRLSIRKQEKIAKIDSKSKQGQDSVLTCSSNDCMVGCQVACSFYQKLQEKNEKPILTTTYEDIATKYERSVVKIAPGKLSWTLEKGENSETNDYDDRKVKETISPTVYVVIQEYAGGKWREIAQTVEEGIEIPLELTSSKKAKLNSIRVLAVRSNGLHSVYRASDESASEPSNKDHGKFVYKNNNSGKVVVVESSSPFTESSNIDAGPQNSESSHASSSTETPVVIAQEKSAAENLVMKDVFEVKVVSLIHQNSLVIAELEWNDVVGNPSQEYLITWELTGGGLKGHLVTDSTSVTLSLWPDTTYQIQVELFQQNFDTDGEQPVENSGTSLKSLPLKVDTSEASFPSGKASALSPKIQDDEEDYDIGDSEIEDGEGTQSNIPMVLLISSCSTIAILIIFIATAFAWTRYKWGRKVCCCTCRGEPYLLDSGNNSSSDGNSWVMARNQGLHPLFVSGLRKCLRSCKQKAIFRQSFVFGPSKKLPVLGSEAPVAVISSSSSISAPNSHYVDNVWRNKSGVFMPTSFSSVATSCAEKVATSPSSSLSSTAIETMAPAVAAGAINAKELQCSSTSCTLPDNFSKLTRKGSTKSPYLPVTTSVTTKIQKVQQRQ